MERFVRFERWILWCIATVLLFSISTRALKGPLGHKAKVVATWLSEGGDTLDAEDTDDRDDGLGHGPLPGFHPAHASLLALLPAFAEQLWLATLSGLEAHRASFGKEVAPHSRVCYTHCPRYIAFGAQKIYG